MPAGQTRKDVSTLNVSPLDGAHQEVPTRVRQREELN